MTWTKLDDSFYDNPKIVEAGNEVAGAFARSLSYCGRHNTDGKLPKAVGDNIAIRKRVIDSLLELGLWVADGRQYFIPDYLEFNPSAEQVEKDREAARERMRELRKNKR